MRARLGCGKIAWHSVATNWRSRRQRPGGVRRRQPSGEGVVMTGEQRTRRCAKKAAGVARGPRHRLGAKQLMRSAGDRVRGKRGPGLGRQRGDDDHPFGGGERILRDGVAFPLRRAARLAPRGLGRLGRFLGGDQAQGERRACATRSGGQARSPPRRRREQGVALASRQRTLFQPARTTTSPPPSITMAMRSGCM